jgi:hypothetical protein
VFVPRQVRRAVDVSATLTVNTVSTIYFLSCHLSVAGEQHDVATMRVMGTNQTGFLGTVVSFFLQLGEIFYMVLIVLMALGLIIYSYAP